MTEAINSQKCETVRIHADGRVEIAAGVGVDEAARVFWAAVQSIINTDAAYLSRYRAGLEAAREACAKVAAACISGSSPEPKEQDGAWKCIASIDALLTVQRQVVEEGRAIT